MLKNIKYICLCLSDRYIDAHFTEIKQYASCIENRPDDSDCTSEHIKRENRYYYAGCKEYDLDVILIEKDYVETVAKTCLTW